MNPITLETLWQAINAYIRRFSQARVPLLAAGLAYYATFSLFPLLLLAVAVFGFALERIPNLRNDVLAFLSESVETNFPTSATLLNATLEDLKRGLLERVQLNAGITGLIGVVALFWGASGFFTVLQSALTLAIPGERTRSVWRQRALAFGLIFLLGPLALVLMVLSGVISSLASIPQLAPLQPYSSSVLPVIGAFLAFAITYRFLPAHRPGWRAAIVAALPTAFVWQAARALLGVLTPLATYQATYGVFAGFLLLLAWLYLEMQILLMGGVLAGMLESRGEDRHGWDGIVDAPQA